MALTNCTECKKQISDLAVSCPGCGAPVSPMAAAPSQSGRNLPRWVTVLVLSMVFIGIFKSCSDEPASGPAVASAPKTFDSMDALFMCQQALKMVSRDPEKANIPYVADHGSGNEAYFAWGASTKMARMRNGLGLEVAASASCTVDKTEKRITTLTLNGKSIL